MTDGRTLLEDRLGRLREAAEAARSIGLETEAGAAEEVAERIAQRSGFLGPIYVMALAGGTGVGKSSILNALAGHVVSPARAVRPTTDAPVAWVPAAHQAELAPLLRWLNVETIVSHDGDGLDDVAILDLPDMDSVRREHRATVDELLPRIDAVTWVVDPEKYDDASEHAYWRSLAPHAERLQFILNKADRMTDADARLVIDDLRARLSADGIQGAAIHLVSALNGAGVESLRAALADAGEAKAIVAAKLQTDVAEAADGLAHAVGLDPGAAYRPLLPDERRRSVERAAVDGALALVDVDGLAQQVRAAVLHRARVRGGSLLSRLVALTTMLTGRRHRRADPAAYLRAWRSRGALGRVLNPLRAGLHEAASALPAAARGRVVDAFGTASAEADVARVLDRAVAAAGADLVIPRSPIWPVIGVIQAVVGAVTLFAMAWIVILFVAGGGVPVGTFDAPWLGPVPIPLALLTASVLVSAALGLALGLHAGWVGRRVAARLASRAEHAVRESVVEQAFAGLDRVEQARQTIAATR